MARRVVSLVRGLAGGPGPSEPSLEANAYAVAEDVELTIVLEGPAVQLAVAGGEVAPGEIAGARLPPTASAHDLRGLAESGVAIRAATVDLERFGLEKGMLVKGVDTADPATIARLLRDAEAVLVW